MSVTDISLEAFGFDVVEFPAAGESVVGENPAEIASPSSGAPTERGPGLMAQQSQPMRDLEQLTLGLDAVEGFTIAWEEYDKYVFLYPFIICQKYAVQLTENVVAGAGGTPSR